MEQELKDKISNLKLGTTQENFLTTTKEALSTIVADNDIQSENITKAQETADNALRVATTQYLSVDYANIDAMITALETLPYSDTLNKLGKGDLIITVAPDEPDFWIVERREEFVTDNDKATLITNKYLETQFGYFLISKNNNDKVNIEGMVKADTPIKINEIVIGVGDGNGGANTTSNNVKGSGKTILPNLNTTDIQKLANSVPTSEAVKSLISSLGTYSNPISYANVAFKDKNGKKIEEHYATKSELANAGEVKEVNLNGTSVLDDNGTANINIRVNDKLPSFKTDDVSGESYLNIVAQAEGQETTPLEATLTEVLKTELFDFPYGDPTTTYKAIKLEATVVVTGVYNSQKQLIVTQPIAVREGDVDYIYYLVATTETVEDTYWYQTIEGNVVGGGNADVSNLIERVESLEKKAFFEHSITFNASNISISSIDYGNNNLMTRSGSIENAIIVRLLSTSTPLNNTNMVGASNVPLSIMGFLKVSMSMGNFNNFIHCAIKSISNNTLLDTYTIVYIDNKTAYTSMGDPILVSEEVSIDIPYANVTVVKDKVTKIL